MKCGDCHSDNTRWPLYSKVAPVSWLVEHDVHEGRATLNLSRWESYSVEMQASLLSRIASEARSGQMPLKQYVQLHPEMRLSGPEQQQIYDWARSERKRLKSAGQTHNDRNTAIEGDK
jgi:cytochrome c